MKKRLISLGMVLVLLVQLTSVAVFARRQYHVPYYAAIGDSICFGYGLLGHEQDGLAVDLWGNLHDSPIQGTYAQLVANVLKAAATGDPDAIADSDEFVNAGIPALKIRDLYYLLSGAEMPEELANSFFPVIYSQRPGSTNASVTEDLAEMLKEEITKADVITVGVGSNDLVLDFIGQGSKSDNPLVLLTMLVMGMTFLDLSFDKIDLVLALAASFSGGELPFEFDENTSLTDLLSGVTAEQVEEFLGFVSSENMSSMLKALADVAGQYYEPAIAAVQSVNPEATVAIVGASNPFGNSREYHGVKYTNAQVASVLITEMIRISMNVISGKAEEYAPAAAEMNQKVGEGLNALLNRNFDVLLEDSDETASAVINAILKTTEKLVTEDPEVVMANVIEEFAAALSEELIKDIGYAQLDPDVMEGLMYALMYDYLGGSVQGALNDLNWYGEEAAEACGVPFVYVMDRVTKNEVNLVVHPDGIGHEQIAQAIQEVLVSDLIYDSNLVSGSAFDGELPDKGILGQEVTVQVCDNVDFVVVNNQRFTMDEGDTSFTFTVSDPSTLIYAHCSGEGVMELLTAEGEGGLTVISDSIGAGFSVLENPDYVFNPFGSYPECYPVYVNQYLEDLWGRNVGLYNLSMIACNTAEVLAILGREDYAGKTLGEPLDSVYTVEGTNLCVTLQEVYRNALADAGIVVTNIGANDIMHSLGEYLLASVGLEGVNTTKLSAALAEVFHYGKELTPELLYELSSAVDVNLTEVQISDLFDALDRELVRHNLSISQSDFRYNQARLFAEMDKRLGSEVTKLCVGLYNPLGEDLAITVDQTLDAAGLIHIQLDCPIGQLVEDCVVACNSWLQDLCDAYGWSYVDAAGLGIETYDSIGDPHPTKNGQTQIANAILTTMCYAKPVFEDVEQEDYFYNAVQWAAFMGVTKGTDDTHFSPMLGVTRAQWVTFLWRLLGRPEVELDGQFTDVESGSYYEMAVAWAAQNGVTKGTSETTFEPDAICTRAQVITMLARLFDVEDGPADEIFEDVASDAYYASAVQWAMEHEVTNGTSETTFGPDEECTRAQAVTFLYRIFGGWEFI